MEKFAKTLVSENEVNQIKLEHNVTNELGQVSKPKSYADVARGSFYDTFIPSEDLIKKFQSKNPFAKIHQRSQCYHIEEINPKDNNDDVVIDKNSLYVENKN